MNSIFENGKSFQGLKTLKGAERGQNMSKHMMRLSIGADSSKVKYFRKFNIMIRNYFGKDGHYFYEIWKYE